jgi:hypothetical protein
MVQGAVALLIRSLPRSPEKGIGPLRVFNDDRLVAGASWPTHADIEGLDQVAPSLACLVNRPPVR